MRLGILTTVWKRPKITQRVLAYYSTTFPNAERLAVCSTTQDRKSAGLAGFKTILVKNDPYDEKLHAGVKYFDGKEINALLIADSDDIASPEHVKQGAEMVRRDSWAALPGQYYLYDTDTGKVYTGPLTGRHADMSGGIYSWDALVATGFDLDMVGLRTIPKIDGRVRRFVVSFKSDENLTPISDYKRIYEVPDGVKRVVMKTIGQRWFDL